MSDTWDQRKRKRAVADAIGALQDSTGEGLAHVESVLEMMISQAGPEGAAGMLVIRPGALEAEAAGGFNELRAQIMRDLTGGDPDVGAKVEILTAFAGRNHPEIRLRCLSLLAAGIQADAFRTAIKDGLTPERASEIMHEAVAAIQAGPELEHGASSSGEPPMDDEGTDDAE